MGTEWVVTTAAERYALNDQRQGELTFTVTNPTNVTDRAVFDVVPGEGADAAWFQVDEPQRTVRGTASVAYTVKAAVPTQAKPGDIPLQARVYSADTAPEESSVLSSRVVVTIPPLPQPKKPLVPWWIWLVIGVLVLALIVTLTLVFTLGGGEPGPAPSPTLTPIPSSTATASPGTQVAMPNLAGMNGDQINSTLSQNGLLGTLDFKEDPGQAGLVEQGVKPGALISRGSTVSVILHVAISAPTQLSPQQGYAVPISAIPPLVWKQPEPYVRHWRVLIYMQTCYFTPGQGPCNNLLTIDTTVTVPTYQPTLHFNVPPGSPGVFNNGIFYWQVIPEDDFGTGGPGTPLWGNIAR
jgi:hypothetical protein